MKKNVYELLILFKGEHEERSYTMSGLQIKPLLEQQLTGEYKYFECANDKGDVTIIALDEIKSIRLINKGSKPITKQDTEGCLKESIESCSDKCKGEDNKYEYKENTCDDECEKATTEDEIIDLIFGEKDTFSFSSDSKEEESSNDNYKLPFDVLLALAMLHDLSKENED